MKYFLPIFFALTVITVMLAPQSDESDMARIHVVANSDSERDIEIKLKVARRVRELLKDEKFDSLDSIRTGLEKKLDTIRLESDRVLGECGAGYSTTVELGVRSFESKTLDGSLYPGGDYLALTLTLGKGEGHNWWSVIFPDVSMGASLALGEEGSVGKTVILGDNRVVKLRSLLLDIVYFICLDKDVEK